MDDKSGNNNTFGYKLEKVNEVSTKKYYFTGYLYELEVYNVAKDATFLQNLVADTCTDNACPFCPLALSGSCISKCALDELPPNCTDCDSSCTNCRHADNCELCTNALCTLCNTFELDSVCTECVEFGQLDANNTCECDATHVKIADDTCGCSSECVTCTANNRYGCLSCNTDYYL
jgi:hypothetical protein